MSDTTSRKPGDPKSDAQAQRRPDRTGGDKSNPDNKPGKLDERLDEALEETFPSSDPVAVKVTK